MKGIHKIFIGFIFLAIRVSFEGFDFFLPELGTIIVATGLWHLKGRYKCCKPAFVLSLIYLAFQIAGLLFLCSKYSTNKDINVISIILGQLIYLLFMFFLFYGLSQIARQFNLPDTAKKIMGGFTLYCLALLFVIPGFFIPYIGYIAMIFMFCIVVKVNRYEKAIINSGFEVSETKINKKYWIGFAGTVLCTIIAFLFIIKISNAPPVKAVLYDKADVTTTTEIAKIKAKMESLEFDKDILNDLPNSEILKYGKIQAIHKISDQFSVDGGKLLVETCISTMPDYLYSRNYRFLIYYKWLEQPSHHYTDTIGLVPMDEFGYENNMNNGLLCLYDKDNGEGLATYKVTSAVKSSDMFVHAFKIPLQDGSCKNQRGYISFNASRRIEDPDYGYTETAIYIHQKILLNILFKDTYGDYKKSSVNYVQPLNGLESEVISSLNKSVFEEYYLQSNES